MLDPKTRRMYYAVNDHVSEDAKKLAIMIGVVEGVNRQNRTGGIR